MKAGRVCWMFLLLSKFEGEHCEPFLYQSNARRQDSPDDSIDKSKLTMVPFHAHETTTVLKRNVVPVMFRQQSPARGRQQRSVWPVYRM